MFGCYHPNIAGMMANDVHVIDLMAAAPSPSLPLNNVEEDQRYSRATIGMISHKKSQTGMIPILLLAFGYL